MKLRFSRRAKRHLDTIADYILERNPDAAQPVGERIHETIELLGTFPYIGHAGALAGTRELVVPACPTLSFIGSISVRTRRS